MYIFQLTERLGFLRENSNIALGQKAVVLGTKIQTFVYEISSYVFDAKI